MSWGLELALGAGMILGWVLDLFIAPQHLHICDFLLVVVVSWWSLYWLELCLCCCLLFTRA